MLPKELETLCVHLPGRDARIVEALETNPETIATQLAAALAELPVAPTLFFGHSLGALLAYDLAFKLQSAGSAHAPSKVILSGCSPPGVEKCRDEGPVWLLPEEAFIERLRELDGTPEEVLASREVLDLFLPVLRADFQLASQARTALPAGLSIDVHVLGGIEDLEANEEDLKQWRKYLCNAPQLTMFPGGHFFLHQHARSVCNLVEKEVAALAGRSGGGHPTRSRRAHSGGDDSSPIA